MRWINIYFLLTTSFLLSACSSNDETQDGFDGFGQPMQISVSMQNEDGITRAEPNYLSDQKTVFITPDIGYSKWYAYNHDATTGLWKATKEFTSTNGGNTWSSSDDTQGLIWTSETMLIYAIVRNDDKPTDATAGPLTDYIELDEDQSTEVNYNKQVVLGTFDRVTYTTGKITLNLQHILGRVVCNVDNCPASQTWTCTSWGVGQHGGNMGINVNDSWGLYFSKGYLKIGDDQFKFQPVKGSLTNFKCWRYRAVNTNTKFCCWMIPLSEVPVCFCFKLQYGNTINYTKNKAYGGVSLLPGKTTTQNVSL